MQTENKTPLWIWGGKHVTSRLRSRVRSGVSVTLFSMARERHIGAPECQSVRHKEPEFIIHVQPWGLWASRAKKSRGKWAFWGVGGWRGVGGAARDTVGCMEGRWGEYLSPPILYLSKPGEGLAAAALPLCLSVGAILRRRLLPHTCHSRDTCARSRSIVKPESPSSWQLNPRRDGSLMDHRLPGRQRAGSQKIFTPLISLSCWSLKLISFGFGDD